MKAHHLSRHFRSALLATAISTLASVAGAASYTLPIINGGIAVNGLNGTNITYWYGQLQVDVSDTFQHMFIDQGQGGVEGDFKLLYLSWPQGGDTLYSADGINFNRYFSIPGYQISATAVVTGLTSINYSVSSVSITGETTSGSLYASSTATPTVPVPGAAWLFGSALVGLGASRIKKQRS